MGLAFDSKPRGDCEKPFEPRGGLVVINVGQPSAQEVDAGESEFCSLPSLATSQGCDQPGLHDRWSQKKMAQ